MVSSIPLVYDGSYVVAQFGRCGSSVLGDVVAQWIERQTTSVAVPGSNLGIS